MATPVVGDLVKIPNFEVTKNKATHVPGDLTVHSAERGWAGRTGRVVALSKDSDPNSPNSGQTTAIVQEDSPRPSWVAGIPLNALDNAVTGIAGIAEHELDSLANLIASKIPALSPVAPMAETGIDEIVSAVEKRILASLQGGKVNANG